MYCMLFNSILSLHVLDVSRNTLFQMSQPKMPPDVVKCPLGQKSLAVKNQSGLVGSFYQSLKR